MNNYVQWLILYGDKTFFTSVDGRPEDAPKRNVQYVATVDKDLNASDSCGYVISTGDWHIWNGSQWLNVDRDGFIDQWLEMKNPVIAIMGRTLPNSEFSLLRREFEKFESLGLLPRKSAKRRNEPIS